MGEAEAGLRADVAGIGAPVEISAALRARRERSGSVTPSLKMIPKIPHMDEFAFYPTDAFRQCKPSNAAAKRRNTLFYILASCGCFPPTRPADSQPITRFRTYRPVGANSVAQKLR